MLLTRFRTVQQSNTKTKHTYQQLLACLHQLADSSTYKNIIHLKH